MSTAKGQILIIEDEVAIAEIVVDYLKRDGFETEHRVDGGEVQSLITTGRIALILLDVMLPGADGFELCRAIRKVSAIPIIMMTARVEEIDRLIGLELGADDYICKPFSPREVVARVKAVLRRHAPGDSLEQEGNKPLEIDHDSFVLRLYGKKIDLTPSEFKLVAALGAKPGRVWSRSQLLDVFLGEKDVFDRTIDSHVKNIRKKIAQCFPELDLIQAVYGIGYRLEL
jgi:two-component system, OmpR family, response regulator BaeR